MKTQYKSKGEYKTPIITQIKLDNEISLQLQSTPPTYENVIHKNAPEFFGMDPLKTNLG